MAEVLKSPLSFPFPLPILSLLLMSFFILDLVSRALQVRIKWDHGDHRLSHLTP
jgi:hypothetical protein